MVDTQIFLLTSSNKKKSKNKKKTIANLQKEGEVKQKTK